MGLLNATSTGKDVSGRDPGPGERDGARSCTGAAEDEGAEGAVGVGVETGTKVGPGTWADDDIAISFTGTGEHIIRSGGAISIAHKVAAGATVKQAIDEVLAEIKRLGGDAGVIVVSRDGQVTMAYNSDGMKRAAVSPASAAYATTFD